LLDPTGGFSLYRATVDNITVYFSLLEDYAQIARGPLEVNWDYIAAYMVMPALEARETGIVGISEVHGGECEQINPHDLSVRCYWHPAKFADNRREDTEGIAKELRNTVRTSVESWGSGHAKVLHTLSGGIDSSIVLACIRGAKRADEVTCLTYYGGGADERAYARLMASTYGAKLIELPLRDEAEFSALEEGATLPRPTVHIACVHQREICDTAREVDAGAVLTGNGGDGLFGEFTDTWPAVDYVHNNGRYRWTRGSSRVEDCITSSPAHEPRPRCD
jgi:asparagine synthase (glutamine-hydrolysing)